MSQVALLLLGALPFAAGAAAVRWCPQRSDLALRSGLAAAIALALGATLSPVDVAFALPSGRSLELSPIAQLAVQLMSLGLLGLILALSDEEPEDLATWLPVAWFSLGGLTVAVLLSALPLALVTFVAAALLWAFGPPERHRQAAGDAILRYAVLLSLTMPLLLSAFRLADLRLESGAGRVAVETAVTALALPGFGLILGLIPLHAWTLTLASGAPRPMLFGVLGLVQTAGFALLLRTVDTHEWLLRGASGSLVTAAGALTALVAAWLALAADPDDPDDWLAYTLVANMGMLLAGLASGSRGAGSGVALFLLARVLALVLLSLSPGPGATYGRLADGAATLTLAGTPGLAGFPGLWLILSGVRAVQGIAALALAGGSGLLFATALRRWWPKSPTRMPKDLFGRVPGGTRSGDQGATPSWGDVRGAIPRGRDRAVLILVVLLVAVGLAPQLVAGVLLDPLRDIFFPLP